MPTTRKPRPDTPAGRVADELIWLYAGWANASGHDAAYENGCELAGACRLAAALYGRDPLEVAQAVAVASDRHPTGASVYEWRAEAMRRLVAYLELGELPPGHEGPAPATPIQLRIAADAARAGR